MTASVVASQEDAEFQDEVMAQEDFEQAFLDASALCLEVTVEECWMAFVEDDTIIQRGAGGQTVPRKRGGRSQDDKCDQETILDDHATVESSLTLHTFEDYPDQITKNLLRNRKQNLLDLNETETVRTDKILHQERVEEVKNTVTEEKKKIEMRDEPSTRDPKRSSKTRSSKDKEVRIESPSVRTRAKSPAPKQKMRDDQSVRTSSTRSKQKMRDDQSVRTSSTRSKKRDPKKEVNSKAKKVERAKSPFGSRRKGAFLVVEAN